MAAWPQAIHSSQRRIDVDIASTDHTPTTPSTGFWVGGAGTLKVVLAGDSTTSSWTVGASQFLPLCVKTVVKVGTTATEMKFLYPA